MGGQTAVVCNAAHILQNKLDLFGSLAIFVLKNFLTVLKQYIFINQSVLGHFAQQTLILGIHSAGG